MGSEKLATALEDNRTRLVRVFELEQKLGYCQGQLDLIQTIIENNDWSGDDFWQRAKDALEDVAAVIDFWVEELEGVRDVELHMREMLGAAHLMSGSNFTDESSKRKVLIKASDELTKSFKEFTDGVQNLITCINGLISLFTLGITDDLTYEDHSDQLDRIVEDLNDIKRDRDPIFANMDLPLSNEFQRGRE